MTAGTGSPVSDSFLEPDFFAASLESCSGEEVSLLSGDGVTEAIMTKSTIMTPKLIPTIIRKRLKPILRLRLQSSVANFHLLRSKL